MKKHMSKLLAILLLTTAPTIADAGNMKEKKKLVGYEVTTVKYQTKAFNKADINNDGALTLNEFANISLRDDYYSIFLIMDKDNDMHVDNKEYASFAPGKGLTTFRQGQKRNWNLNQDKVIEKHFVMVQ